MFNKLKKKIKKRITGFCERGQHCSCWFDSCWGVCCKRHDRRYSDIRLSKKQADLMLFRCVRRRSNKLMASLMYIGVVIGGQSRYDAAQEETIKNNLSNTGI